MGCDSNIQRKRAKEEEEGPGLMGSHSLVGFCCCYFLFLVFFFFFLFRFSFLCNQVGAKGDSIYSSVAGIPPASVTPSCSFS